MDLIAETLVKSVAMPVGVATAALIGIAMPWRRVSPAADSRRAVIAGGVAVGLAYIGAHLALSGGWPALPPRDTIHWMLAAAAFGVIRAVSESFASGLPGSSAANAVRWTARAALLAFVVTVMLWKLVRGPWTPGVSAAWVAGCAAAGLLWWRAAEGVVSRAAPLASAAVLTIAASAASAMSLVGGSMTLAQHAGAVAAATGPLVGLALWRPDLPTARGTAAALAFLTTALLAYGTQYNAADTKVLAAASLLVMASVGVAWAVASIPAVFRCREAGAPWPRRLAAVIAPALATAIVAGAAIALVVRNTPAADGY